MSDKKSLPVLSQTPLHAFAQALHDSGMGLKNAAGYMQRANLAGQVGFSRGLENRRLLQIAQTARDSILTSLSHKLNSAKMNANLILALCPQQAKDLIKDKGQLELSLPVKKMVALEWLGESNVLAQVFKRDPADLGRSEIIDILSGADIISPLPIDSWERLHYLTQARAVSPPSIQDKSSAPDGGTFTLEPSKIEVTLQARALAIMERFELGNIRISGLPSLEQVDACLSSLELGLSEIARGAGIPERVVGLGGKWTIHLNADVGQASGYCSIDTKTIALSTDNGWCTLAHEWFHALDASASIMGENPLEFSIENAEYIDQAKQAKNKTEAKSTDKAEAQPSNTDWSQVREAAYGPSRGLQASTEALHLASLAVITCVRAAVSTDAVADVTAEEDSKSVQRIHEGLFERFYKNRLSADRQESAPESFRQLCRDMLDGKAGLKEISAWRVDNLGDKAYMCRHYDAFILAERTARDSRVRSQTDSQATLSASTMQRFAHLADENLSLATGTNVWNGYSTSATEMSARGFEGNCFLDTPDPYRHYLVDGRDNSMYWPVGAERGAHTDVYRAYIACAVRAMIDAGSLPADVLKNFNPMTVKPPKITTSDTPKEPVHDLNIARKLITKRIELAAFDSASAPRLSLL